MILNREELAKLLKKAVTDMEEKGFKLDGVGIINDGAPKEEFESLKKDLFKTLKELTGKDFTNQDEKPEPKNLAVDPIAELFKQLEKESQQRKETKAKNSGCTDDQCFCGQCNETDSTFEDFEKNFGKEGSIFDKTSVTLHNRVFDIKYHLDPDGHEDIMIYPKEDDKHAKGYTLEVLQQELSDAVQAKRFDEAQKILDIINENFKK